MLGKHLIVKGVQEKKKIKQGRKKRGIRRGPKSKETIWEGAKVTKHWFLSQSAFKHLYFFILDLFFFKLTELFLSESPRLVMATLFVKYVMHAYWFGVMQWFSYFIYFLLCLKSKTCTHLHHFIIIFKYNVCL